MRNIIMLIMMESMLSIWSANNLKNISRSREPRNVGQFLSVVLFIRNKEYKTSVFKLYRLLTIAAVQIQTAHCTYSSNFAFLYSSYRSIGHQSACTHN